MLWRSLMRAVVARCLVLELCAGRRDSTTLARSIQQRLAPHRLALGKDEMTAFAGQVVAEVRRALRRCRPTKPPAAKPPAKPGSTP